MNIETLHKLFLSSNSICTDTRKIKEKDLFFALTGDNFNGNIFAKEALLKGASYAVIDEPKYKESDQYIVVDNSLKTLQQLARFHRDNLGLKVIALTGSNGKTTTKELLNAVLSEQYKTVATQGNLNNHIGVPLTLLSMDQNTEIGIVEMGANHLQEIEFLCDIAKPNYGYITNFGKAHLEGFGSMDGVIKGKSELYGYLISSSGLIFINANDPIQNKIAKEYDNTFIFNTAKNDELLIEIISVDPFVKIIYNDHEIISNLIGAYNYNNIAAAITIGHYFEVPPDNIKSAIENYVPDNMRSQVILNDSNKILLDAYNANPTSMKVALDHFSKLEDAHKIAILGDMFELGREAKVEHENIASYATQLGIETILLVGKNFFEIESENDSIQKFETFEELQKKIKSMAFENHTFLIKGSRGMALERILESIK